MSVTYQVKAVEFGEAITPGTGATTINAHDYGVALTLEKTATLEDGSTEISSLVMSMSAEDAAAMSRSLSDAAALARFKEFISKVKKVMP